jgi:hypothetical protein
LALRSGIASPTSHTLETIGLSGETEPCKTVRSERKNAERVFHPWSFLSLQPRVHCVGGYAMASSNPCAAACGVENLSVTR